MPRFTALLFLGFSSISHACDEPVSETAERELWSAYEVALQTAVGNRRDLIAQGQRAWLDYRDANCELIAERSERPAGEPYVQCVTFMTRERTLELRLICRTAGEDVDCDPTP
jgi:uncharacterized protein YecT (DUF1311 family)